MYDDSRLSKFKRRIRCAGDNEAEFLMWRDVVSGGVGIPVPKAPRITLFVVGVDGVAAGGTATREAETLVCCPSVI